MPAPPAKHAPATAANEAALRAWLDSILAFEERACGRPWLFYEELDAYLGPWHEHGYLIGYGKKYCQLFSQHQLLRVDREGARWMEQTLLLLQQELQALVLQRHRAGTLASLSERELRSFAFSSHSRAYIRAGLTRVALRRPSVVVRVIYMLRSELSLGATDLCASIGQVLSTLRMLIREALTLRRYTFAEPAPATGRRRR